MNSPTNDAEPTSPSPPPQEEVGQELEHERAEDEGDGTPATGVAGASPIAPPHYYRDPEHRLIAGVAAGLAGATGIHVVIIRIAFVVAGLLHGVGVLAYVAAWIALPRLDDAIAGRPQRWPAARTGAAAGLAAVAVLLLLIPFLDFWLSPSLVVVVALLGIAVALWQPTPQVRATLPSRSATDALPALTTPQPPVGLPSAAATSRAPRGRSRLGRLTGAAALLAIGGALALDQAGVVDLTAGRAASLVLVVLGGGLLVSTVVGRAPWLVLAVVVLTPITVLLGTSDRMGLDPFAGIGPRWDEPLSAADVQPLYRHGTGVFTVDLSQADLAGTPRTITVENAFGNVNVLVPDDTAVTVDGTTALGDVVVLDQRSAWGPDRHASGARAPANAKGSVRLHLRTGFGSVAVYTRPPDTLPTPTMAPPLPSGTPGGGA